MIALLYIHFSFLCRFRRSNKKGQSPIVLRVFDRQERKDVYTRLYCKMEDGDTSHGKVFSHCRQATPINSNLKLINYKSMRVSDALKFSGIPLLSVN
jgi:Arm DNA-binding domain